MVGCEKGHDQLKTRFPEIRERVILSTAHADDHLTSVAYFIELKVESSAHMKKKTFVNENCVSVYYQTQRNCAAQSCILLSLLISRSLLSNKRRKLNRTSRERAQDKVALDKAILTPPNNHTLTKPNQPAPTPRMRPRITLQRKVTVDSILL